jgi:hypothetical protein
MYAIVIEHNVQCTLCQIHSHIGLLAVDTSASELAIFNHPPGFLPGQPDQLALLYLYQERYIQYVHEILEEPSQPVV